MPSSAVKTCARSEEHTSELQSHDNLVCRLLLEKKNDYGAARPCRRRGCGAVLARRPSVLGLYPWRAMDAHLPRAVDPWPDGFRLCVFLIYGGAPKSAPLPQPDALRI